jgi:F0F1-type ATP synthase assembly protein I
MNKISSYFTPEVWKVVQITMGLAFILGIFLGVAIGFHLDIYSEK